MEEMNKQEGKQVTNEEIMEHLNEIENALSLIANVGATLMLAEQNIINGRKENEEIDKMIEHGLLAVVVSVESLGRLSGFNKRVKEMKMDRQKETLFDISDMIFK